MTVLFLCRNNINILNHTSNAKSNRNFNIAYIVSSIVTQFNEKIKRLFIKMKVELKVTFLKHFALEEWVSIYNYAIYSRRSNGIEIENDSFPISLAYVIVRLWACAN